MSSSSIRRLVDAAPFRAFEIHIADGRKIPVHHREFIMISPADIDFVVYQPDGAIDVIATNLVTGLHLKVSRRKPAAGK
jgi:hypothetical protein